MLVLSSDVQMNKYNVFFMIKNYQFGIDYLEGHISRHGCAHPCHWNNVLVLHLSLHRRVLSHGAI